MVSTFLFLALVICIANNFAQATLCGLIPKGCCHNSGNGEFIYSKPLGGKIFMIPTNGAQRKGDWTENFGFCKKHCAEMVTIQSAGENTFFLDFARSSGSVTHPGVWLGGRFQNKWSPLEWANGERVVYSPMVNGEPNEPGFTCLNAAWDNAGRNYYKWRNDYCKRNKYVIACQKTANTMACCGAIPRHFSTKH